MKTLRALCLILLFAPAVHAEVATIVFTNGQVVILEDTNAYQRITAALQSNTGSARFVELGLKTSSYLLNLDEIVMVCREDCRKLVYRDPRSTDDLQDRR